MKRVVLIFLILSAFLVGCTNEEGKDDNIKKPPQIKEETVQQEQEVVAEVTNESNETVNEEAYLSVLEEVYSMFSENMGELKSKFAEVDENPNLYQDEEWKNNLRIYFDKIGTMNELFKEIEKKGSVPQGYEEVHKLSQEGFSWVYMGGDALLLAMEGGSINQELYSQGIERIETGLKKMLEARVELNGISD